MKFELTELKFKLEDKNLTLTSFQGNSEKVKFYTGLNSFSKSERLFIYLEPFIPSKIHFSKDKPLIMTLMKLRLNLNLQELA